MSSFQVGKAALRWVDAGRGEDGKVLERKLSCQLMTDGFNTARRGTNTKQETKALYREQRKPV